MKQTILVVDDEAPVRDMLNTLLTAKGGYLTAGADSAAQMFERLNERAFDLVLLDVVLGDANGLDLLPLIRNAHPTLPVLVLSALGFEEDFVTEARHSGANGFLRKTMSPDQLLGEVRRALAAA